MLKKLLLSATAVLASAGAMAPATASYDPYYETFMETQCDRYGHEHLTACLPPPPPPPPPKP